MENYNHVSFFTASILDWKDILHDGHYKNIIIDSMRFLVEQKRVNIQAFVIMPTHIHIVWKVKNVFKPSDVQRDFLKFTAQQFKFEMIKNKSERLSEFLVNKRDRIYQFWQRKPLVSRLPTVEIVEQKINYIHFNPVRKKWNLCSQITDYRYSSARFYHEGIDEWGFLTHYMAEIDN